MATAKFLTCASATYGLEFWDSTTGTVTVDSANVRGTSPRSYKLNVNNPAVTARARKNSILADAGRRISLWVYFPSVSQGAIDQILAVNTSGGGANIFLLRLTTSNKIDVQAVGVTNTTGTTTIAAGTWYRLTLAYTITSSTVWTVKAYINGVLEVTISNGGTLPNVGSSQLEIKAITNVNFVMNFDEVYVDDGSDNADPGGIGVTAKRPASNNVNNFNTAIGANPANRWTNVNERPISETNGWSDTSVTSQAENYGLETASAGDVDISTATVVARTAWVWAKQSVAVAGSPQLTDNGTNNALTLTTTSALYTVITTSSSYPSNAAGIGMKSAGVIADATNFYECGTIIAYLVNASATAAAGAISASAGEVVSAPAEAASGAVSASASVVITQPSFSSTLRSLVKRNRALRRLR